VLHGVLDPDLVQLCGGGETGEREPAVLVRVRLPIAQNRPEQSGPVDSRVRDRVPLEIEHRAA
jgi:hypothetical protein